MQALGAEYNIDVSVLNVIMNIIIIIIIIMNIIQA